MYNLILDADALIKLTQCGIIEDLCRACNCFITHKVKEEAVDEGRRRFYPDAEVIDNLINSKLLKIKNPTKSNNEYLSKGELTVLNLYKSVKNHIIVSDDQVFIRRLEEDEIPFLVAGDVIPLLKRLGKISTQEALHYLKRIKTFIREDVYRSIKQDLEEQK